VRIRSIKMESAKVYKVIEYLYYEDMNPLNSCNQFLGDSKQLDLFE